MSERSERIIVGVRSAHGCTVSIWNLLATAGVHE